MMDAQNIWGTGIHNRAVHCEKSVTTQIANNGILLK